MYILVGIEKSVGGEDLAGDLVHRTGGEPSGRPRRCISSGPVGQIRITQLRGWLVRACRTYPYPAPLQASRALLWPLRRLPVREALGQRHDDRVLALQFPTQELYLISVGFQ
jgi:hypothetical protein